MMERVTLPSGLVCVVVEDVVGGVEGVENGDNGDVEEEEGRGECVI